MKRVKVRVHVRSRDGLHEAVLVPGDVVPEWATVTNPAALAEVAPAEEPTPAPVIEEPAPAPKRTARRKATPAAE